MARKANPTITDSVTFRPSLKSKEILSKMPPEAANKSDWIEYLLTTGYEVAKYGKEQVLNNSLKSSNVDHIMGPSINPVEQRNSKPIEIYLTKQGIIEVYPKY